jgi:glucose/arabinose dehydrogenase
MAMRIAALALLVALPSLAATLPAGFTETTISGLTHPATMGIAPDGRVFVCEQLGALRVIKNGVLLPAPFVTIDVNGLGERGLLGVTFDPDFVTNHYVYVYYTTSTPTVHNRISRFTAAGDVAAPNSEVVLFELDTLSAQNHNGGAIHFGRDGKLYAGVGENAVPSKSQTVDNLLGKVLRINKDGTIPGDNPFINNTTGKNRAIWTLGLRNPFTFGVHPNTGRIFINDVGQASWEEINDGIAGANYGWPHFEGQSNAPGFTSPLHSYPNDGVTGCAIAGGAFYAPEIRQFPPQYADSYFFADFCGGWIRRFDGQATVNDFAAGISNPVDLGIADDGSLYYLSRGGFLLRHVRWTQHLEGDVNGDNATTMADAFYLINYFNGSGPAPVQGGDVDNSGVLDSSDLTYLIAYLLGRGPTPV